jgi:hypothetical protein
MQPHIRQKLGTMLVKKVPKKTIHYWPVRGEHPTMIPPPTLSNQNPEKLSIKTQLPWSVGVENTCMTLLGMPSLDIQQPQQLRNLVALGMAREEKSSRVVVV